MVEIKGMNEVKAALLDYQNKVNSNLVDTAKLVGNEYKSDVQEVAPYLTGTYRRSMHVEVKEKSAYACTVVMGTNLPQARILEYGGVIKPKNGEFLVFTIGEKKIFARLVHRVAQPHFIPTMEKNRTKYINMADERLARGT